MQWAAQANGGFSRASASRLRRPVPRGPYGPDHVNVADQRADPGSLHAFITLLVKRYRESPELGWSGFEVVEQPHQQVFAHLCRHDDRAMVALHNLAPDACTVPLALTGYDSSFHLVDLLLNETPVAVDDRGRAEVTLDGYGYRWLRLQARDSPRLT
jgi:glycosidase